MKKFKFPLQKVLDLRVGIENDEKNKLALMYAQLNELLKEKDELRKTFEETARRQRKAFKEGVSVSSLQYYPGYFKRLEQQAKELEERIENVQEQIKEQIQRVLKASQDKEVLAKLKEKRLDEYEKELSKANERFIDEFVSYQMVSNMI